MQPEPVYTTHNSFILRTPLFPFGFNKNLVNEPEVSDDKLNTICNKPLVQEACSIGICVVIVEHSALVNLSTVNLPNVLIIRKKEII